MNRNQRIMLSIIGIFIVLLALVGITYAYFLTQIRGNDETKSISIKTADLILEYGDTNSIIDANKNLLPGDPITPKLFTVSNKGNGLVEGYKVYLEGVQNQLELKDDLTYTLTCKSYKTTDATVDFSTLSEDGTCTGSGKTTFPSVMSVIATNNIAAGYTHLYELQLSYPDQNHDQSVDMNKKISAKVNIYDGKTKFLATEIINNTTLNKTNNSTTGTLYTLPNELPTKIAEEISGSDERILSYTLDDLGTSYYYRGNVNDNYVNFAGKCWRIVRIEGDGSVKLILEDKNKTCDDETYTGEWSIGVGNYGYYTFKDTYNDEFYRMSYLEPVDSADKSMVKAYYDFQNTFTTDELKKLKAGNWCLGDTAYVTEQTDFPYIFKKLEALDYTKDMYYDSYVRLDGDNVDGYNPTYKCNGSVLNNFVSVIYNEDEIISEAPMYVSGITADEIVYAGSTITTSADYYLLNEYQKEHHFWTISPSELFGMDRAYFIHSNSLTTYSTVEKERADFRPMITLSSTVSITTKTNVAAEPGTQTNPYVIN